MKESAFLEVGMSGGDVFAMDLSEKLSPECQIYLQELEDSLADDMERELAYRKAWSRKQLDILEAAIRHHERLETQMKDVARCAQAQQDQVAQVFNSLQQLVGDPEEAVLLEDTTELRTFDNEEESERVFEDLVGGIEDGNKVTEEPLGVPSLSNCSKQSVPHELSEGVVSFSKERTRLERVVLHPLFDVLSASVIIGNAIFVGYASDYGMSHLGEDTPNHIKGFDYFFLSFYIFELLVKLAAFHWEFFKGADRMWNVFDLFLVLSGVYDTILEVAGTGGSTGFMWMRLLRLLKMVKMLRLVRVMRFFKDLRLMFHSLAGSLRTLLWSVLILGLVMYIFGLCFLQAVTSYLQETPEDDVDSDDLETIEKNWSTVGRAMLTLYKAVTGGADWGPLAAPLKKAGGIYYALFLFYIAFVAFAVLNILTGIFVDAALSLAAEDRDAVLAEEFNSDTSALKTLRKLFLDIHPTGAIAWKDFEMALEDGFALPVLLSLDIEVCDAEDLFKLLEQGGSAKVTAEDFLDGCLRFKGQAKNVDLVTLRSDTEKYREQLCCLMEFGQQKFAEFHSYLEQLGVVRNSQVLQVDERCEQARCPLRPK